MYRAVDGKWNVPVTPSASLTEWLNWYDKVSAKRTAYRVSPLVEAARNLFAGKKINEVTMWVNPLEVSPKLWGQEEGEGEWRREEADAETRARVRTAKGRVSRWLRHSLTIF